MVIERKARFGLKSFVTSRRVTPPGNTKSSPATGVMPSVQFASRFQFPLELPSQNFTSPRTAATAHAKESSSRRISRRRDGSPFTCRRESFSSIGFLLIKPLWMDCPEQRLTKLRRPNQAKDAFLHKLSKPRE